MSSSQDTVGAWPAPPGVTVNFTNPESIGYQLILAAVICPVLTAVFLGIKLHTSRVILRRWSADDSLIIAAFTFALGYSIINLDQVRNGAGVHIWNVPLTSYESFNRLGIAGCVAYNLSTLFTKASILVLYLRFAIDTSLRVSIYIVMFVVVGYSLAGAFGFLYLCHPIERIWDYSVPGSCVDISAWYLACAALNTGTDFVILLLPIWILWPMHLPISQRLAVMVVLMAGGFVCGVSVVRLTSMLGGLGSMDVTWTYLPNLVWCLLEMYTGILCACLPSLKPFIKHNFPSFFASRKSSQVEANLSGAMNIKWAQGGPWTGGRTSSQQQGLEHFSSQASLGSSEKARPSTTL